MKKYTQNILIIFLIILGLFGSVIKVDASTSYNDCVNGFRSANQPVGNNCDGLDGGPGVYHYLAPLPCPPGQAGCTSTQLTDFDAGAKDGSALGIYINTAIKIIIGLSAVFAVVMIVIGGIEYMTSELSHSKEDGKERIWNAVFGLLIALGSYALLNTINPDLLNSNINVPGISVSVNLKNIDTPQQPVNGKYGDLPAGADWASTESDKGFTNTTLPSGVSVNAGECKTVGQSGCTSLVGLDPSIINALKNNCTACSNITITGGTEYWLHNGITSGVGAHYPGYATIDLAQTTDLNTYITGSASFPNNNQVYHSSQDGAGICYLAEAPGLTGSTSGAHWHAYTPVGGKC